MPPADDDEPRVFRVGGISYLRIPAEDPRRTAAFYHAVFRWNLRGDPEAPSFDDGTGHVIGHFTTDLPVAGEAGVRPYIYVERVDDTLDKVASHGGEVVTRLHRRSRNSVRRLRRIPRATCGWPRFATPPGTCSACGNAARVRDDRRSHVPSSPAVAAFSA